MEIIKTETSKEKNFYFNTTRITPKPYSPKQENQIINIYPNVDFQTIIGFGAAITESAAYSYSLLPDNKKVEFMNDMFSNINYSLCRLSIGSCDFSLNSYTYAKKHDLSDFNIERDKQYIIPFIKDAQKINPNILFLASPWSPPGFMKNIKILTLGGHLSQKYKQTYADYFVKFINSYRELGINIDYITIQNEPNVAQSWESCLYSAEDEVDFLVNYLYPTFLRNEITTKILVYDHNKEKLYTRALAEFSNPEANKAASGIAFHWYTGNHFDNIKLCRKTFPDKLLIHTEGCMGYNKNEFGQNNYAHDMIEDLNAGIHGYIDWNILLDSNGGPNHKRNFCNSPVMLTEDNSDYNKSLAYYYIGHISKFIQPGSVRIGHSRYREDFSVTAFRNPDNSIAIVVLNMQNYGIDYNLCMENITFWDKIDSQSIISYWVKF